MAALTLVIGDEEFLVARAVSRALAEATAAVAVDEAAPSVHDLEAAECAPDVIAELLSPSLFGEQRLIVIRNLQEADQDVVAALAEVGDSAEPGISIVAAHPGGAKGKAALEALRGAGARVVEVGAVKSARDREQFAIDEVRAAGASLDRDAAAELVAAVGSDLRELATAAAQLSADVGGQISADDVATYYRGRAESTGFAVADRAVEGNTTAALETLRWAFATGLDPILVSSSLAANLRLIAQVGGAGPGSAEAVAARLRLPAWKVRRAQGWLRHWRPEAVGIAVRAVATADADLKGGADDAAYAVERAVLAVAAAAHPTT
jgi:DNA polymerase III subunit delta